MAKTFPESPYFDDFDSDKNYLKILFRPSYSVQARELNSLQSQLQNQIEQFGDAIFKNKTKILGGTPVLDTSVSYVKVKQSTTYFGTTYTDSDYLATNEDGSYALVGKTVRGTANGFDDIDYGNVEGEIIAIEPPTFDGETIVDPLTVYIKFTKSGGAENSAEDGMIFTFEAGEQFRTIDDTEVVFRTETIQTVDSENIYPTGFGTLCTVPESVYYIDGFFVHAPQESIIVGKYSVNPYKRVVYEISENIITANEDSSLLDNALGAPNLSAAGAHRFNISLTLRVDFYQEKNSIYPSAIPIITVEDGRVVNLEVSEYSELGNELAKRTFEESGNYFINPFKITAEEVYRDESNIDLDYRSGLFTSEKLDEYYSDLFAFGENAVQYGQARLALSVGDAGNVAYINGFRIELNDSKLAFLKKARTFKGETSVGVNAQTGNFVIATYDSNEMPDLFSTATLKVGATDIGTAIIRNIVPESSTEVRVFLSNISIDLDTDGLPVDVFSNVTTIESGSITFTIANAVLNDPQLNKYFFKLPYDVTKSANNIFYNVRETSETTLASQSSATWALSAGNIFGNQNADSFLVWNSGVGVIEPTSISFSTDLTQVTFNFPSPLSGTTKFYGDVRKNIAGITSKIKTRKIGFAYINNPTTAQGGSDVLVNTDIIKINAINMSSSFSTVPNPTDPNVADRYFLDNGQRDSYYDFGRIQLKCNCQAPTGRLLVQYEYYDHTGTGDAFTQESYTSEYELIPEYNDVSLRDVLDFRPDISEITGATAISLAQYPTVTCNLEYYLPKYAKVGVTAEGEIFLREGRASLNPAIPEDLENSVTLATVLINAYTFSKNDISIELHQYKRFTMSDIARLEDRVRILENLHDLNTLEEETLNEQFLDTDGSLRFKNGFLVNNCKGHIAGYTKSLDYAIGIDPTNGTMRPATDNKSMRMILNEDESSNIRVQGSVVSLNYYSIPYLGSNLATFTDSITDGELSYWRGAVNIYPSGDSWRDNVTKPYIAFDDNANGRFDYIKDADSLMFNAIWGEWDSNWAGLKKVNVSEAGLEQQAFVSQIAQDAVVEQFGEYIADISTVPFIRSRKIYFEAKGLKPNTRYFPFFGDVNISNYTRKETEIIKWVDNTAQTDSNTIEDFSGFTDHPDGSSKLISDSVGTLKGSFIIPNQDNLRFPTGTQKFILSDKSDKYLDFSSAEATYEARGVLNETYIRLLIREEEEVENETEETPIDEVATSPNEGIIADAIGDDQAKIAEKDNSVDYYEPLLTPQAFYRYPSNRSIKRKYGTYQNYINSRRVTNDSNDAVGIQDKVTADNGALTKTFKNIAINP